MKTISINKRTMKTLAFKIQKWCEKKGAWDADECVAIFFPDGMISPCNKWNVYYGEEIKPGIFFYPDLESTRWAEYSNPKTITLIFDGSILYDIFNGWKQWHFDKQEEFDKIIKPYNLYHEMGTSIDLSLFEI